MEKIGSTTITNEEYLELISIKEKTKDYDELKKLVEEAKKIGLNNISLKSERILKLNTPLLENGECYLYRNPETWRTNLIEYIRNSNNYYNNISFENKSDLEGKLSKSISERLRYKIEKGLKAELSKEFNDIKEKRAEIEKEKAVISEMSKKLDEYALFDSAVNTQYDIINNLLDKLIRIKNLAKKGMFIRKRVLNIIEECKIDDVKNKIKR